jgi:glycosyltransferase involved in cell wall biosynthesis
MITPKPIRKLRVLHVPDMYSWVTWTIAREYSRHNPWIEPTICSMAPLRDLIAAHGKYPGEVDLVHFQLASDASLLLDPFEGKVPCVATIHHVETVREHAAEPRCDAVTTASDQWYDYLTGVGVPAEKLVKLTYGVDADQFRPAGLEEKALARGRLGLPADAVVAGFSAKRSSDSSSRKGVDTLVKMMEEATRRLPDLVLLMIGPGWADVASGMRERGIRCRHIPFVHERDDLASIYRGLDVYWITSRIEGGPVPLLEAMSSGVCCVTTPVGMARDLVVDGENGMTVAFDDVEAFIARTEQLAREPGLRGRISQAARRTIVEGYTWEVASRPVWHLYKTAIDRFRARPGVTKAPTMPDPGSWNGPPARLPGRALGSPPASTSR